MWGLFCNKNNFNLLKNYKHEKHSRLMMIITGGKKKGAVDLE